MRVGKKLKLVETKRTRSCVVRLEKVRSPPPPPKSGRSIALSGAATSSAKAAAAQDDKKFKGPLKKRPFEEQTSTPKKPFTIQKANAKAFMKTIVNKSPPVKMTYVKTPLDKSPHIVKSPMIKSPMDKSPLVRSPLTKTPIGKMSIGNTTISKTPTGKTPIGKAPIGKSQLTNKTPMLKTPIVVKTPVAKARPVKSPSPVAAPLEATPTIAAGRSRRAIKPNPKYASDDIVTPKMIKNVSQLANAAANRKSVTSAVDKKRKRSTSSSEDFYNKDSSDMDYLEADEKDKAYAVDDKDSDSDFTDIELDLPRSVKGRGRPAKAMHTMVLQKMQQSQQQQTSAAAPPAVKFNKTLPPPTITTITAATPKNTPSQLQQLRRTIAANRLAGNRITANATLSMHAAKKRKFDDTSNDSDSDNITVKRKKFISAAPQNTSKESPTSTAAAAPTALPTSFPLNHKTLMSRKSLANQTLNGSKVVSAANTPKVDAALMLEKRKAMMEKAKLSAKAAATQNAVDAPAKLSNKPSRTSSPVTPKPQKPLSKETTKAAETSPSATIDDFETMPTFTIVNINDIINKKGDVLISKANESMSPSAKAQTKDADVTSDFEDDDVVASAPPEPKPNRRKAGHTTILSEKPEPTRSTKMPAARTPLPPKKPAQTILNHTLMNKNGANRTNQRPPRTTNTKAQTASKPAPRILNSMVAKKTQPVKPMIANMDDSADESYPMSLDDEQDDDEDEEEDEDELRQQEEEDEEEEEEDLYVNKRRTRTPLPAKKQLPIRKENSNAATNRITDSYGKKASTQRQLSPEKVVISRQGDKIIKKITCFENWYIINMPEDQPAELVRNQLDIPLVKLANASDEIELPSAEWSSKVTLYQLAASLLSKSNYATYTGDLTEHNIDEEDRAKYQPSCVMFRRSVSDRTKSRVPYDRAVIFKNKSFFTNIEGKNVKLVGAPFKISSLAEIEVLLQLVDELSLQSSFVEPAATVQ